jgi:hypothetical protein
MRADGPFGWPRLVDGPEEARRLDMVIESLTAALERVAAGHAYEEARGVIDEYRRAKGVGPRPEPTRRARR